MKLLPRLLLILCFLLMSCLPTGDSNGGEDEPTEIDCLASAAFAVFLFETLQRMEGTAPENAPLASEQVYQITLLNCIRP